ncbi:hypothetical protein CMUS01_06216 [Colletotrichum musicola]|uniref:Uncharacterized protein n=1 Tax=Colletotrichum musicola TaxID=2175873 RepID=A0A8H6KNE7_9PEZI|nr:hypothetical protein CMUS01_06216 [Colletotrichum musicola]
MENSIETSENKALFDRGPRIQGSGNRIWALAATCSRRRDASPALCAHFGELPATESGHGVAEVQPQRIFGRIQGAAAHTVRIFGERFLHNHTLPWTYIPAPSEPNVLLSRGSLLFSSNASSSASGLGTCENWSAPWAMAMVIARESVVRRGLDESPRYPCSLIKRAWLLTMALGNTATWQTHEHGRVPVATAEQARRSRCTPQQIAACSSDSSFRTALLTSFFIPCRALPMNLRETVSSTT